jgi:hypothetical protein
MATMRHLAKEPRRSIFNFVFLAALGIELRDSHLLYQADSTICATPPSLLGLGIFQNSLTSY